jgi:RimJ/RimL family protein N-acetyltransferase
VAPEQLLQLGALESGCFYGTSHRLTPCAVARADRRWTRCSVSGTLAAMANGWRDAIEVSRGNGVRLRRAELEEYEQVALPWYQDPEVLQLSEAGEPPYDHARIRRMFEVLSGQGELYLIEVQEAAGWRAVGDAALLPDAVPIVIGRSEDRSRGIGTEVLQLLLLRARALGWTEVRVKGIDPANRRSRRLFERAGFVAAPTAPGAGGAPIAMTRRLKL